MPRYPEVRQGPEVIDIVNALTAGLQFVQPPYDSKLYMSGNSSSAFAIGVQRACNRIMVEFCPVADVYITPDNDIDCMLDFNRRRLMDGESRFAPAAATAAARVVKELAMSYPVTKVIVVGHGRIGKSTFRLLESHYADVALYAHDDVMPTDGTEFLVNCTPSGSLKTTNGVAHVVDVDGGLGGGHIGHLTCAVLARRAHRQGVGAVRQLEYSQI